MIQVKPSDRVWIRNILQNEIPQAEFYIFGSRVKGTAKIYSDLDVVIKAQAPIALLTLSNLEQVFAESNIPYKIDLIDWSRISAEFQQKIQKEWVEL